MTQVKSLGSPFEELEFCRDALSDLSFLCADLEGAGISVQDQKERVMDLIGTARNISGLSAQKEMFVQLESQAEDAAALALTALQNREDKDGR